MEFAPLAAAESGGDVEGAQGALGPWFVPVLLAGAIPFLLGAIGFATAIVRSRVLGPTLAWPAAIALIVMAVLRVVPMGGMFYIAAAAGIVAFWPLAFQMWRQREGRDAKFLAPDQAVAQMTVMDGFAVNTWAAEPRIVQPMAFAWDDRGRLWVAENRDYESRVGGFSNAGNSRILILDFGAQYSHQLAELDGRRIPKRGHARTRSGVSAVARRPRRRS